MAGNSFTYDANGNLTTDGTNSYLYDIENRMVGMSGSRTASLRYDPLGRLYEVVGSGSTTRFLMGGDELVGEYDSGGTLLRRYVHGADVAGDDPIAWYEGSAFGSTNERFMRPDWQGSIVLVTDSAGSSIIAKNSYDEWGIPNCPIASGGPDCSLPNSNAGRFQYTGQAWINETGLYYYKARMYSPTLGRFMQTDPIGYKDQVNLYGYVGNDPVDFIDPLGLKKVCSVLEGYTNQCSDDGSSSQSPAPSLPDLRHLPAQSSPQSGLRGVLCSGGKLAKSAGDAGVDAGLEVAVLGGLGGAAVGAFAEGVGAIPGAIAGATPGLSMAGVAGTVGSLGQFAMDLSTSHSARDFGVASIRAGVGVFGGRIIGRVTRGIGRAWLDKAQQLQRGERIGNVADQALSKLDGFLNPGSGC